MTEDIVKRLGYLCLGSRLKRLGERMQADVQRFIEDGGVEILPSQYPLLAAIDRSGALTIGELADALGVSQPGVTRNVTRLVDLGLLEPADANGRDRRHKAVALTKAGAKLVARSKQDIWPHIEASVREVCAGKSGPLLDQIAAIEDALAAAPLDRRAAKFSAKNRTSKERAR